MGEPGLGEVSRPCCSAALPLPLLALYVLPAVILGELQTPSGPLHRICRNSQREYFLRGREGVSCHLLDPVEDGALHLPSGCAAGGCAGSVHQGPCPGRCVSDFWAWGFWLQEHRVLCCSGSGRQCALEVMW